MADNTQEERISDQDGNLFDSIPSRDLMLSLPQQKVRAIYLFLTGSYTPKKIANIIGCSEMTIRRWFYDETVQKILKELQERESVLIDAQLKVLRNKALTTMEDLMDSPLDPVRFSASKDILDRTGHKPVQEMKIDKKVTTFESQMKSVVDDTISDQEVIDVIATEVEEEYDRRYGTATEEGTTLPQES